VSARDRKKIEAMEASSKPMKILSEWLDIFELSETFEQYLKHLSAESPGRKLATLMPILKSPGSRGTRRKARGPTTPDLPY
jgi:hypothetical protein